MSFTSQRTLLRPSWPRVSVNVSGAGTQNHSQLLTTQFCDGEVAAMVEYNKKGRGEGGKLSTEIGREKRGPRSEEHAGAL